MSPETVIADLIARRRDRYGGRPLVVGICGAQGSGKSTVAAALAARLPDAATLSLDDLYLPRADRQALARTVHPLFATRGVPGTHDVVLGLDVLAGIDRGEPIALPRFDKARDDRLPRTTWDTAPAPCHTLFFEGWCVGARAQDDAALATPINALERDEDRDGVWRRHANAALAGGYQRLFDRVDLLVLLAAPDLDTVRTWRGEQEAALARRAGANAPGVMTTAEIDWFVRHYERLTRHILAEMPERADLVLPLSRDRTVRRAAISAKEIV